MTGFIRSDLCLPQRRPLGARGAAQAFRCASRALTAALLLGLFPLVASAACGKNQANWLWDYDGTLGETYRVRMTLVFRGDQVNGLYFYATQLKDIALQGRITDGTHITLDELDANSRVVARFDGQFAEQDSQGRFGNSKLECEVIVGSWQRLNATTALPLRLSMTGGVVASLDHRYEPAGAKDDALVHQQVARFWNAVKRADRKAVAAMITYPIKVRTAGGGRQALRIPVEFMASYDAIFTPQFRESITSAIPRNMFSRDQGIMLGNGEVWFGPDGKVIALNN